MEIASLYPMPTFNFNHEWPRAQGSEKDRRLLSGSHNMQCTHYCRAILHYLQQQERI